MRSYLEHHLACKLLGSCEVTSALYVGCWMRHAAPNIRKSPRTLLVIKRWHPWLTWHPSGSMLVVLCVLVTCGIGVRCACLACVQVLAKSTGDTLPRTMQCALAQAMNTTRCGPQHHVSITWPSWVVHYMLQHWAWVGLDEGCLAGLPSHRNPTAR